MASVPKMDEGKNKSGALVTSGALPPSLDATALVKLTKPEAPFHLPLHFGALCCKIFFAVANSALRDVAGSVLGVLAAAEALSAGAASASFASSLAVGKDVVMCPHESTRLHFAFSLRLLDAADMRP